MKHALFLLLCIGSCIQINAQYQVQVQYHAPKDSILYFRLTSFEEKLFIPKDTAKLIQNKASFSSKTPIFGGFYTIFLPKTGRKIQICLENKDNLFIKINGNKLDSIAFSDTKNKLFYQYQVLEESFAHLDSQYAELIKKGTASLKFKEALYKPKKDTLLAFRNRALNSLKPGSLLHKYFGWLNTIDTYSPNRQAYVQRATFISQFPLQDPQLYFSPILKDVLYEYLSSYPLHADSLFTGMEVVMKRLNCKDKAYPNTFNYFTSVIQGGTIKNNLEGYNRLIEKYLINSSCSFLPKPIEKEYLTKYNQYKQLSKADSVIQVALKDTSGTTRSLREVVQRNNYTIICFYDPGCEHCQIQIPELDQAVKAVIEETKLAVEVYAICNTPTMLQQEWKKFIQSHKLDQHFVHVIIGEETKPREDYAAYMNPMFFLANKNGIMLLKKTTVPAIKKFLLQQK